MNVASQLWRRESISEIDQIEKMADHITASVSQAAVDAPRRGDWPYRPISEVRLRRGDGVISIAFSVAKKSVAKKRSEKLTDIIRLGRPNVVFEVSQHQDANEFLVAHLFEIFARLDAADKGRGAGSSIF
jgi:hypothetical protein